MDMTDLIKKLQINICKNWIVVLSGIILYIVMNVPFSFGYIEDRRLLWSIRMFIGIFLTIFIMIKHRLFFNSKLKMGINAFIRPYIFVSIISFLSALYLYGLSVKPYISQSLLLVVHMWTILLIAYFLVRLFGIFSIKIFCVVGIISYITVIIRYISIAGIYGILHPFNYRVNGVGLEVHGLTYCFVLIILLALLNKQLRKQIGNNLLIIITIFAILGNKRAAYLSAVIVYILNILIKKSEKKNPRILFYISSFSIIFLVIYVGVIKFGILQWITHLFGINDSFRFNFWNYFSKYYNFSIFYLGRSLFFSDYYMTLPEIHKLYNFTGQGQIHNDILRTYIGWGFIPFVFYYHYILKKNLEDIANKGYFSSSKIYLLVMIFFYSISCFDNMIGTYDFNLLVVLVYLLLINKNKKREYIFGLLENTKKLECVY